MMTWLPRGRDDGIGIGKFDSKEARWALNDHLLTVKGSASVESLDVGGTVTAETANVDGAISSRSLAVAGTIEAREVIAQSKRIDEFERALNAAPESHGEQT